MANHGMSNTRIYRTYAAMKQRCYNPNTAGYSIYGGKGITICDEWLADFMNFYNWAVKSGYKEDLTIDRIDPSKGYNPDNCQWLTKSENSSKAYSDTGIHIRRETYEKGRAAWKIWWDKKQKEKQQTS